MFYDYADAVSAFINKKLIRLFAGLKTVLPIDEINLLGSVNAVYEEADKILRQKLLHIAKKTYRELGGEIITVGSDAHFTEHVAADFDKAADILKACGFQYYNTFIRRQPVFCKL